MTRNLGYGPVFLDNMPKFLDMIFDFFLSYSYKNMLENSSSNCRTHIQKEFFNYSILKKDYHEKTVLSHFNRPRNMGMLSKN